MPMSTATNSVDYLFIYFFELEVLGVFLNQDVNCSLSVNRFLTMLHCTAVSVTMH